MYSLLLIVSLLFPIHTSNYITQNLGILDFTQSKQTINKSIEIAQSFQGLNSQQVQKRFNKFYRQHLIVTTHSWCAIFVNGILKIQGYPTTNSLMARSFLNWGISCHSPSKGDIVVFRDMTSEHNPEKGHVAFFVREQGDRIYVLGGNQDDIVKIKSYPKSCVIGFRTI